MSIDDSADPIQDMHRSLNLLALRQSEMSSLVDEHRTRPFGPHSDALSRVLNILRGQPVLGKLILVTESGNGSSSPTWRIARMNGRRSAGGVDILEEEFDSIEDAEHQAFLRRLQEWGV